MLRPSMAKSYDPHILHSTSFNFCFVFKNIFLYNNLKFYITCLRFWQFFCPTCLEWQWNDAPQKLSSFCSCRLFFLFFFFGFTDLNNYIICFLVFLVIPLLFTFTSSQEQVLMLILSFILILLLLLLLLLHVVRQFI